MNNSMEWYDKKAKYDSIVWNVRDEFGWHLSYQYVLNSMHLIFLSFLFLNQHYFTVLVKLFSIHFYQSNHLIEFWMFWSISYSLEEWLSSQWLTIRTQTNINFNDFLKKMTRIFSKVVVGVCFTSQKRLKKFNR
jgi:hypothetical protein